MAARRLEITPRAARDIRKAPHEIRRAINDAIDGLAEDPMPPGSKKLQNNPGFRFRVKGWRIVYTIEPEVVTILRVAPRSDGYEKILRHTHLMTEGSSWRSFVDEAYWLAYDVTISTEGPSGRKRYEVHVGGKPYANRNSLAEAKAAVEDKYGPIEWQVKRLQPVEVTHYHFGPTSEFTSPSTIWVADFTL